MDNNGSFSRYSGSAPYGCVVRPLIVLIAVLIAAATLPVSGEARMRGGFARPAFARFRPRFERMPPRGPFPPAWPLPPGGQRPPMPPPPLPSGRVDYPPVNSGGYDRPQQDTARQGVREGQMAPLGGVIENLQHRAPGRQLDTNIEYEGGRTVYRVRWLTNQGQRIDYIVDAASGRVIGER
jgi:hypothetical protein